MSVWSLLRHHRLYFHYYPPPFATFGFCYGLKPMMVVEATENTDHWAGLFNLELNSPVFGCFRQFTKYLLRTLGKERSVEGEGQKNLIIKTKTP
jgi:hypothetical protein